MFTLGRPTEEQLRVLIERNKDTPFSYAAVGATRGGPLPPGYTVDRNRVWLGSGHEVFKKAEYALRSWTMLDVGWVSIFPRQVDIQPGAVVAVVVSHFGFWSIHLSKIVFVENPCCFAYGTLEEHTESGEEKFTIRWDPSDDSVWYEILAFSKPRHSLAMIAYPMSRLLQWRFARDSMRQMQRCIQSA